MSIFCNSMMLAPGGPAVTIPTQALSFASASSQFLSMSDTNWGSYNRAKWSFSAWFKSGSNQSPIIAKRNTGNDASAEFALYLSGTGAIIFLSFAGSAINGQLTTTATFSDNTYHHILVHFDSANATANSRMRIWIDGTEITSFGVRTNPTSTIQTTSEDVRVGADNATRFMNGSIFQPAFFSGVLTGIGSVYNAGHPMDVRALTGLFSLLNTNTVDALTKDYVLATAWTNNNTVTKSSTIPT